MNSLWSLDDVSLPGRQSPRLDRLTVEIPHGVTVVLGQSGAGKTSLLNLLVQFEQPASGQVRLHLSRTEKRLPVFWSPPHYGLWPHLTIIEHLQAVNAELTKTDSDQLLADFDLSSLTTAKPDSLSLGERSRVSVARALASQAEVLVMDEPLAHVDTARLGKYWAAICQHWQANDTSLVFSSHSSEIVLREASHLICLTEGRLSYSGDVRELYDRPSSVELALMLGPCNWLTVEEETRWIRSHAKEAPAAGCIRPERLSIEVDEQGTAKIEAARFVGSSGEVDLIDTRDGARRTFVHRPTGYSLQTGDRVLLRLLALFLVMLIASGGVC